MNNIWNDERNRLKMKLVKAEIYTKMNYDIKCEDFMNI